MRSRRMLAPTKVALSALTLSLLAAACAGEDEPNPQINEGPLHQAFEDAALETGVPKDLLLALGWYESRWVNVQPESLAADPNAEGGHTEYDHFRGGYGVMQLTDREDNDTLGLAAALTELPKETVRTDAAANIKGAAHVLRRYADEMYEGVEVESLDLFSWRDVIARWSGLDDPELAFGVADEVFAVLREGAGKTLEDGEVLELMPNEGLGQAEDPALSGDGSQGVWGSEESGLGEPGVHWVAASHSNYTDGRGGQRVRYVVIHTMQGGYAGSISWFRNPSAKVSAHYAVRSRDGDITQLVDENDTAWHAGNWTYNQQGIGIEHEGFVNDADWYTDRMYRASAALVCHIVKRHGIPVDRQHILGHVEVPGASHTDPGRYWNWTYYMSLIRQCTGGGGSPADNPSQGGSGGGGAVNPGPGQGQLQGIVYANGDTSKRIAGARITLSNGKTATTGSNGYWSLNVPAGSYTITATASGYRSNSVQRNVSNGGQVWGSLSLARDTGGGSTQPQTGRVSGVIFDADNSSRRISGAAVQVNGRTVTTDANGRYTIEATAGSRTVEIQASGYLSKQLTVSVRAGQTSQLNAGMVRRAATGTVVGVVYELPDTKKRIGGARVTITNGVQTKSATADGSGYFEFKGVDAGTWRVSASASGYASGTKAVSAVANQERWGSVGLKKAAAGGGQLIGVIYESPNTSKRIPGATVTLSNGTTVSADSSGVYRANVSGTVSIVASAPGYAPRSITRTVNGQTWGSIGLVKGSPGGSNSQVRCEPKGVPRPHNPPKMIKLIAPLENATVGRTPTFEFEGNGDPEADYVVVVMPAAREEESFEFKVDGAQNRIKAVSPKALDRGPYAWSVYALWPDCDKSIPINFGFFSVSQ